MVLTGLGLKVLKKVEKGEKIGKDEKGARVLELSGILKYEIPGYYSLTYTGESLLDIVKSLESKGEINPQEWKDNFRFIGSEIIGMIDATIKAKGRVAPPFEKPLMERGFAKDGRITEEGEEIWEIYRLARPQLVITKELADFIKKLPYGPSRIIDVLTMDDEMVLELEAQRLIAFSMPPADFFNFTGLGQKVKRALELGYQPFPVAVSIDILVAVKRAKETPGELSQTELEMLQAMGCLDENGELLPAGEALYSAYKLYTEGPMLLTPSIVLKDPDIEVLFIIDELWEKNKTNPEILPTYQQIRDKLEKKNPTLGKDTQKLLYSLECFGMIKGEMDEKRRLVYNFTDWGKKVLEDQKRERREISSPAVKCITMTRKEFSAPNAKWHKQAVEEKLLGPYEPTKSGMLYTDLAVSIDRLPHITDTEMEVLRVISDTNPLYVEEYLEKFDERRRGEIERALESLDAKGFVEILPTDIVILTEAGEYLKKALSGTPSGFKNPVNPFIVRIIEAIREVGSIYEREKKIRVRPDRWRKVEELSGLDPETFSEMMTLARKLKFIGTNTLTDAGYNLLLSLDALRKAYGEVNKWFIS